MTCPDCFTRKFHNDEVVTVGEYGNVLWTVREESFDGVTLRNLFPVAGSPRVITVPQNRVKSWSGRPKAKRISRKLAAVVR